MGCLFGGIGLLIALPIYLIYAAVGANRKKRETEEQSRREAALLAERKRKLREWEEEQAEKRRVEDQERAKRDAFLIERVRGFKESLKNTTIPDYVAYDLETTGLSPTSNKILEIGAVKVVNHEIIDTFQELIDPGGNIPKRATEINGITNEMVKGCRTIDDVLPDFMTFVGKLPMVAHNAEFDYSFIQEKWLELTGKKFTRKHYCTMKLYRKYHGALMGGYPDSSKLKDVYWHLCEKVLLGHHRSLSDATAVMEIFEITAGAQGERTPAKPKYRQYRRYDLD